MYRNLIVTVCTVVALAAIIAGAWYLGGKGGGNGFVSEDQAQQDFIGAAVLMSDDRSSITLKTSDGTERIFRGVTSKIPVLTLVTPGQAGKKLEALNIGDVLKVVTDPKDTSHIRRIVFLPFEVAMATTAPLATTLVSSTDTSITIPEPMPAGMPASGTTRTYAFAADMKVFTEVEGEGQKGKSLSEIGPGTPLLLYVTNGTPQDVHAIVLPKL